MNERVRVLAVDTWREYVRINKLGHDFYDPPYQCTAGGYLDGARALLAFIDTGPKDLASMQLIRDARAYVEELRLCYCAHYDVNPDEDEDEDEGAT